MKNDIHPKYHSPLNVTCVCGASFQTGSTKESISIEVCSHCHPFFTGKQRLVDTARRVEKFQEKITKAGSKKKTGTKKEKQTRRQEKKADKTASVSQ